MPAATQTKRKRGNQTRYTQEAANTICEAIAKGATLVSICKQLKISPGTICLWVVENRSGFAEMYAKARMAQAHLYADQIITLADDRQYDVFGELQMPNNAAVNRSRLMVDTRKFILSKVLPKIYGDKLQLTDADGGPVQFVTRSILEDAPSKQPLLLNGKTIEGKE